MRNACQGAGEPCVVSGAQVALGRVCTGSGFSALSRRETPVAQLPSCASANDPAPEDAGADAGLGQDAGVAAATPDDAGSASIEATDADDEPDATNYAARWDGKSPKDLVLDSHGSCSVRARGASAGLSGLLGLVVLALLGCRRQRS